MSFNIDRFGSDASNVKSIFGGVCYYRYFNKDNNDVTVAGYFPASLGLQLGDRIKVIPATKTDADEEYIVSDITNRIVTVIKVETGGSVDTSKVVNADVLPTASADNVGYVYLYTGTTDASYTHGYIYECKAQGTNPETYAWEAVEVQASGGSGLPDQTGQSGKFLTTDGTDASWATINALQNEATGQGSLGILMQNNPFAKSKTNAVALGFSSSSFSDYGVAVGSGASVGLSSNFAIAIGYDAIASAQSAIQLGNNRTNSDANTFKVANDNGNFELMSADGTIPADRLASTTGLADGNYRLRLTMANGVPTLTWVAE